MIDCIIEDPRWADAGLEGVSARATQYVFDHFGLATDQHEVAILGCDDARIKELNSDFRDKDTATNVLSWPSDERGAAVPGGQPDKISPDEFELGDIAISFDTCHREATQANKPFEHHVVHLIVHANLHLLGYDHIDDKDAALMESIEIDILEKMGVPNPYAFDGE
jgi:probable rRNA maturation factor